MTYFLLHYFLQINERHTPQHFKTLNSLDCNLPHNTDLVLTQTLFFGKASFTSCKNLEVLISTNDSI